MSYRRHLFAASAPSVGTAPTSIYIPEFNIAILGTLGVGKSALTVKYITKRFIMEYDPEIEDIYTKLENIEGQDVRVTIMDTYDTDRKSPDRYLKWAQAFIVVYSITSRASFDDAQTYLETISQYQRITGKDLPVALVGNKMDLERYRTVSRSLGEDVALQFECSFYETSAADDYASVELVFVDVVREVARINDRLMPLQSLFISEDRSSTGNASTGGSGGSRRPLWRNARSATNGHSNLSPLITSSTPGSAIVAGGGLGGHDQSKKDTGESKLIAAGRKTGPSFKFFPKSFKIFN